MRSQRKRSQPPINYKRRVKFITKLPVWVVWGLAFPLIVLNGWLILNVFSYFQSLITVFIAANLFSFILDYGVQFLVRYKVRRNFAVFLVILLTLVIIGILGVTLVPFIFSQLNDLASKLPSWLESGSIQLQALNDWAIARKIPLNLNGIGDQFIEKLTDLLKNLTGDIFGFAVGTVGSIFDLVLTIILTFYLLLNGEQLWNGLCEWLPPIIGKEIRPSLRKNFHNYFVGQASLASIIGVCMTLTFIILQVPFGSLFGLLVGFMGLFPFGVTLSITILSFLTALKSFWLGARVLIFAAIVQQIIENGVAPRLLAGFTGLNPVWVLISLLTGAKIGGLLGLIVAVPMAGFIKNTAIILRNNSSVLVNVED
jgi:predicted PurR-regulated permease PerM